MRPVLTDDDARQLEDEFRRRLASCFADPPQYPMCPTVCLLDHDCNAPPAWHWLFRRLPDPLWHWWLARHADDYVCP